MRERIITTLLNNDGVFKVFLTFTGYGSAKFGACEVCGEPAGSVFVRRVQKRHKSGLNPTEVFWSHRSCVFGHKGCLENNIPQSMVLKREILQI